MFEDNNTGHIHSVVISGMIQLDPALTENHLKYAQKDMFEKHLASKVAAAAQTTAAVTRATAAAAFASSSRTP